MVNKSIFQKIFYLLTNPGLIESLHTFASKRNIFLAICTLRTNEITINRIVLQRSAITTPVIIFDIDFEAGVVDVCYEQS